MSISWSSLVLAVSLRIWSNSLARKTGTASNSLTTFLSTMASQTDISTQVMVGRPSCSRTLIANSLTESLENEQFSWTVPASHRHPPEFLPPRNCPSGGKWSAGIPPTHFLTADPWCWPSPSRLGLSCWSPPPPGWCPLRASCPRRRGFWASPWISSWAALVSPWHCRVSSRAQPQKPWQSSARNIFKIPADSYLAAKIIKLTSSSYISLTLVLWTCRLFLASFTSGLDMILSRHSVSKLSLSTDIFMQVTEISGTREWRHGIGFVTDQQLAIEKLSRRNHVMRKIICITNIHYGKIVVALKAQVIINSLLQECRNIIFWIICIPNTSWPFHWQIFVWWNGSSVKSQTSL